MNRGFFNRCFGIKLGSYERCLDCYHEVECYYSYKENVFNREGIIPEDYYNEDVEEELKRIFKEDYFEPNWLKK